MLCQYYQCFATIYWSVEFPVIYDVGVLFFLYGVSAIHFVPATQATVRS